MKYIVMECFPSYAVLLDEEGRFFKAANLHYQVGQAVFDPVLMKEAGRKKRPALRWLAGGIAAAAACCLLFFQVFDQDLVFLSNLRPRLLAKCPVKIYGYYLISVNVH